MASREELRAVRGCDDDDAVRSFGDAALRRRCDVAATVVSVEATKSPSSALSVVLDDGTGRLQCWFLGRESIPAVHVGRRLRVEGRVVRFRGRRCLLNPSYELLDDVGGPASTSS